MEWSRRRHPRIDTENVVRIIDVATKIDAHVLTTLELGVGGCLLRSQRSIGIGRVLILNLSLGVNSIRVIAKVLYEYQVRGGGMNVGLEFLSLSPEDTKIISEYIGERLGGESHSAQL